MDRGAWNYRMMGALKNWHWTRWLRFGVASVFLAQGGATGEPIALIIGSVLMVQAVLDRGCSPAGHCAVERKEDAIIELDPVPVNKGI